MAQQFAIHSNLCVSDMVLQLLLGDVLFHLIYNIPETIQSKND